MRIVESGGSTQIEVNTVGTSGAEIGWVLFRAASLTQVGEILARIGAPDGTAVLVRADILPARLLWGEMGEFSRDDLWRLFLRE